MSGANTVDEGYDDLDDAPGLSGFYILIIFLAVLAVFAGIVYVAYQKGLHANAAPESDLPIVVANPSPARTEVGMDPVDPGRSEVDEQLNDPTPSRVVAQIETADDPLEAFDADGSGTTTAPETAPVVQVATPDPATVAPVPSRPVVASPSTPSVKPATTTPDPQPARPAARDPQPAVADTVVSTAATHSVQVGAFGSRDEAMEFYGSLMRRYGSLVGNQRPEVRVATVKGRDYHRLWVGAFGSRSDADTYCKQLSAQGQDCYVQKR